ncbi:MAG: uroporphyrinogen decarboxylase family protein [bacterium]
MNFVIHFIQKGIKVIFHSDGNVSKAMDALICCGIDGFNPLEISAGMDYESFKEEYGNKIVLVGGLDAVEILSFATPEVVISETKRFLEIAGKGGGLISASSSGQLDNSMPFENIMASFETVWRYIYKDDGKLYSLGEDIGVD